MIRINLMPRAEARRQAARARDRQVAILILAALVAIVALTEFFTRRTANRVQAEADEHQTELAQLSQKHNAAIQLDRKRKELEAKVQTIKVLERQRKGPVHVLDDLGAATPDTLWLTEMRESGGMVTLMGRGLDNQTIALFMRNLAASPYFTNVDLVETKQVEEGQAKLKEFSIRANVLYGGRPLPTPAPPPADAPAGDGAAPAPAPAAGNEPHAQEALDSAPGTFGAPNAARQAAKLSDARNANQDAAAAVAAGEPHS
ncbi:MAG: PilN domain-containing protein [Candidatus Binatia bacterium]